jgi:hypothetical protein
LLADVKSATWLLGELKAVVVVSINRFAESPWGDEINLAISVWLFRGQAAAVAFLGLLYTDLMIGSNLRPTLKSFRWTVAEARMEEWLQVRLTLC